MGGPWDAWFSQKQLDKCDHYNIYADAEGNEYLCTMVGTVDGGHGTGWDDMVHLGTVTKHVRRVEKGSTKYHPTTRQLAAMPIKYSKKAADIKPAKAINNYVCPACSNDKCNRTEKSCWKCGFLFNKS